MDELFILMIMIVVIMGIIFIICAYFQKKRMDNKHEKEVMDKFDNWSSKKVIAFSKYKKASLQDKTNRINRFIKSLIKFILL
jgi:hypothetical protein